MRRTGPSLFLTIIDFTLHLSLVAVVMENTLGFLRVPLRSAVTAACRLLKSVHKEGSSRLPQTLSVCPFAVTVPTLFSQLLFYTTCRLMPDALLLALNCCGLHAQTVASYSYRFAT